MLKMLKRKEIKKIGNIFLPIDYINTLGVEIKLEKVMVVDFCGGMMKIKVKEILVDGIKAEIVS